MRMTIDKAATATSDILTLAAELRAGRRPFALATVIESQGSTSARPGSKAILGEEGRVLAGWVGGGCADSAVGHAAIDALKSGAPRVVDLDLDDEVLGVGMPCGGSMRVFVEPVRPQPTLWILGHGRVAECLCRIGALMGLDVVVDDPMAEHAQFPDATRLIAESDYDALLPEAGDFVVVATQHKGDHQSMSRVLGSDVGYIALIASRKRAGLVLQYLRDEGFDDAALARVRSPAGLDLGAETPEEIALSVISEIVLVRRKGDEAPGAAAPASHRRQGTRPRALTATAEA